ncbi:beta-hydroxyacyl-ACP dehydratase [Blastopirellula sp. JC732]|uniref:Beta-hydroxyacyl-ACP dehydratase n=1 Tax=Blastopirellula sediminis TaxID=2894196 RepID=A0A9X1MNZ3_9BACT|nr:3-hydroxyacyl-ACP dehydratase FabZ family protein [Blastopirellula sediminis]MCC9606441.1 beta-hydroxyacyl-ACP dehydratase [Blastopirellula sediminis]MCC9630261.1 beta-hydroxyacyl-ACP dehydratase [Blastopirellula sediminis]
MRWFWVDKFLEFESGKAAKSVKSVTLAEDHIHDHFPGIPIMPHSLVIEGIAQTGGLLVGEYYEFRERVVLAKVSKATFHFAVAPGDQLTYSVEAHDIREDGAYVSATSHCGDRLHAEVELFFAHLDEQDNDRELFGTVELLQLLRMMKVYEIGKKSDGTPIEPPQYMLDAEAASLSRN